MSFKFGILSTYPPTQCGLATFSKSLLDALQTSGAHAGIVSVVDTALPVAPSDVDHQWVRSDPAGAARAADALNRSDVAIIQHEYGIFPGRDGVDVLDVVRQVRVPVIAVLHTVLTTPSPHQRGILEALARRCVALITMTETARDRLIQHYAVTPDLVRVIPHGAADGLTTVTARPDLLPDRPAILTWGLLGEGKGIEWAIEAMSMLTDVVPKPQYYVLGQTHPRVLEQFGERYRDSLIDRVEHFGLADSVRFDSRYQTTDELHQIIARADVVLLPYDSVEQVTSGVLIEAVAAGKPVVSTAFPHARELLSAGAGLLVNRQDPAAIAGALRRVLTEPDLADSMREHAQHIAPSLRWSAVADSYCRLALDALRPARLLESA